MSKSTTCSPIHVFSFRLHTFIYCVYPLYVLIVSLAAFYSSDDDEDDDRTSVLSNLLI